MALPSHVKRMQLTARYGPLLEMGKGRVATWAPEQRVETGGGRVDAVGSC